MRPLHIASCDRHDEKIEKKKGLLPIKKVTW